MATVSFPYTSVDGDRKVTAFQEASGFAMFVSSGVVEVSSGDLGTALQVSKVAGSLGVSIALGNAVVNGHRYIQDGADTSLTLDAGGAQGRIDVIAIESDRNTATRAALPVIIKGTESASPVAPALTETDTVYQIALAEIAVPAGATTLNAATLTDRRTASRPRGLSSEAEAVINQFPIKKAVLIATTGSNLAALSGLIEVDGVTLQAGDRILVKDQTDPEYNGIYVAASGAWARAGDMDSDAEAVSQMLIPVEAGTANAGTTWQMTTTGAIELGTTELTFVQFDTDEITAGNGLQRVADEISMRTPGNISLTSTNKADGTDHTHALVLPGLTPKQLTLTTANEVAADGHTHDIDLPGLTPLTITSSTANSVGAGGHSHAWTIPSNMQALTFVYRATGTGDGEAISDLVNAFLDASGVWTGTTERALKLLITGTLGLPATPAYGTGLVGDPYRQFNFTSTQTRGAIVEIDWSDARGLAYVGAGEYARLILQTGAGARVKHSGLTAKLSGYGECEILAVMSGAEAWVTGGRIECEYNGYADYFNAIKTNAAKATIIGSQLTGGIYSMTGSIVLIDDCIIDISASFPSQSKVDVGIQVANGNVKVANSYINVYSHFTGASEGSADAYGLYVSSGQLSAVNCIVIAKAECDNEWPATASACYVNASSAQSSALLSLCRLLAYEKSADAASLAYAIMAGDDTQNTVVAANNTFPEVAVSGYTQTGAILLEGTTEGATYLITGNVFGGADGGSNIIKHSDSDPAANYYMANNMFGVNLG